MKVLIVGGGGREHALAWKAAQSDRVETVYIAPGNAGTAREPKAQNVPIGAEDIQALRDFAKRKAVDLTIVGPEAPLVAGIVDVFVQAGLRCLGPTQAAARLEGSKCFAKDFLRRHGIPTAEYRTFTDTGAALAYIREHGAPLVIKADGLAAGKGVVIAENADDASRAAERMLSGKSHGDAGRRIVIEEYLKGEEASFICLADGEDVLPFPSSQDHKRRDEGDRGPNTGGMGAYSPAPLVTPAIHERIMQEVIKPTLRGMIAEGSPYRGFLYAGLMIAPDGTPNVLEFNCRFGDPEAQPVLLRLKSDFIELCEAALDGRLKEQRAIWDARAALGIVLAAAGYPENARAGDVIEGLDADFGNDVKVFHAGTKLHSGKVITGGGRVLCVTALGATIADAQQNAYRAAASIRWDGMFYRRDIGYRAVG